MLLFEYYMIFYIKHSTKYAEIIRSDMHLTILPDIRSTPKINVFIPLKQLLETEFSKGPHL